jgi:hypothetical protein
VASEAWLLPEKSSGCQARFPKQRLRQGLKEFHFKSREETKIMFFDNVDVPNVDKLSLYGTDLVNTSLFEDYGKHGDLWYVVARSGEYGYVVGITPDASMTIFNLADREKYLEYVATDVYPLASEKNR